MGTAPVVPGSGPHQPIAAWRWGVIWLMFLATLINYMDRQTLGAVSVYIVRDFGLTEAGYGWIEFWFGISFGLFQFPAGYLADRWSLRWLYAAALLLWSAAGFLTGLATEVIFLSACRLVLGIGEAFNWPCAVGIVRRLIPLESRSLANGIFHGGASIGAVLTPLLALYLIGPNGENWQLLFQIVGALGLVWAFLWLGMVRGQRAEEVSRSPAGDNPFAQQERFRDVFRLRHFWIALSVGITVNLCWHFYRIWLPRFLKVDLHFTQDQILYTLAGFFVAADLGSMAAGWMTRRLAYAGFTVERSRKLVMLATASLCLLSTPAALVMQPWVTMPLLFLVAAGAMGGFANYFALSQEISPRHTSLCNGFFGTCSWLIIAVLQPPIGALVDRIGTFAPSLIVIGCVPLVGALIGLTWPEEQTHAAAAQERGSSDPASEERLDSAITTAATEEDRFRR